MTSNGHAREFASVLANGLRRAPLLPVALGGMAGIAFSDGDRWWAMALSALAPAAVGMALLWRGRSGGGILLGAAVGLLVFSWWHAQRLRDIEQFPLATELERGRAVEVDAVGWLAAEPRAGEHSVSTLVEVRSLHLGGHEIRCRHRLPAWIQQTPEDLDYGARIRFEGVIRPLDGPEAPGAFDPATFYFRQSGSLGRLEIREGDSLEVLPGREGSRLRAVAIDLRRHLEGGLLAGLSPPDEPYARLVGAMSLGARENAPEELEDWFRRSGTMHIFAVSGLHVGIVGGLLLGVALALRVPRKAAVLVIIPLVLFYALLTGLRPSALRAAIMLSLLLASFAVKERPRLVNSLALAALLILAADTQQLFLPGFQLSFAVLLCIALLASPMQQALSRPWLSDPFLPRTLLGPVRRGRDRLVAGFTAALAVSLVSWLGSLGPLAWHFRSCAPVGIVANLFLVPLAAMMVTLAVVSLSLYAAHLTWATALINKLNVGLAILSTTAAQFFAGLPRAHIHTGHPDLRNPPPRTLTIDAMGTRGEGAALLSLPPAQNRSRSFWMIDCGGRDTYRRQMLPVLRSRAVNRLDALLLTHGDIGHIGAGASVLSQFRPGFLFEAAGENRSPAYPEIVELASTLPLERTMLSAGQRLALGGDVRCRILAPERGDAGRIADDRALVLALTYRGWTVLFTSDAGFATEKRLVDAGIDLDADVWIRGQHRHSPAGIPAFVEAVSPAAVISTHAEFPPGERLSPGLRSRLADRGAALFPLDTAGVVTVTLGPDELLIHPHADPGAAIRLTRSGETERIVSREKPAAGP